MATDPADRGDNEGKKFVDVGSNIAVRVTEVDSSGNASEIKRVIESTNSSSDLLGNGGDFTGEWFDALNYMSVVVEILTDEDSAVDGFEFQSSSNASDVQHIHKFSVTDNEPLGNHYVFSLTGRYYRIVYTNGTTPQGNFVLNSSVTKTDMSKAHAHPVEHDITGNHPAQVVRAIIAGKKPNNDYVNVEVTSGGNLKVSVEEYEDATNPWRSDLEGVGDVTIGTSEVEIAVTGTPTFGIRIQADNTNTGIIYIGKTGIANDGSNDFVRLESGDDVIIPYNDADNALYARSDTAAQTINVGALL